METRVHVSSRKHSFLTAPEWHGKDVRNPPPHEYVYYYYSVCATISNNKWRTVAFKDIPMMSLSLSPKSRQKYWFYVWSPLSNATCCHRNSLIQQQDQVGLRALDRWSQAPGRSSVSLASSRVSIQGPLQAPARLGARPSHSAWPLAHRTQSTDRVRGGKGVTTRSHRPRSNPTPTIYSLGAVWSVNSLISLSLFSIRLDEMYLSGMLLQLTSMPLWKTCRPMYDI